MLEPIVRRSAADLVFDQLVDEILGGGLEPGASLPAERALTGQLGVSRGAVREALQRLSQAGLVKIRQGDATRVRDFRESGSLGLLPRLLVDAHGSIDPIVVRSTLEMRISIAEDAARLCATRASDQSLDELDAIVEALAGDADIATLQEVDLEFWRRVIDGSENVVYRLAYNSLVETYEPLRDLISDLVEPELRNLEDHRAVVAACRSRDGVGAARAARRILESSSDAWTPILDLLDSAET